MLQFTGEKMSKSSGKVETIRDAIDKWGRETILVFFLGGHWRKPIDYSEETLLQAQAQVRAFRASFAADLGHRDDSLPWEAFEDALNDDFNTPKALAVLHRWRADSQTELMLRGFTVFGLESLADTVEAPMEVRDLALQRKHARDERDFEESDRLRDELARRGWEMRDRSDGYDLVRI